MALRFKPGTRIRNIAPELILALIVTNESYAKRGFDCTVTSCNDGNHRRGSLHYIGHAADLRTWEMNVSEAQSLANEIRFRLEPLGDFDVILESAGTPNMHIHIEYQPKGL